MSIRGPEGQTPSAWRKSRKAMEGSSITEAVCGAGVVVLAILGLAGVLPPYLASIAAIALGVALLAQGGAIAARYSSLVQEAKPFEWDASTEIGGGMGAEIVAGGAGVVLGILGLLGLATGTLLAIAVIVFGLALLLGGAEIVDIGSLAGSAAPERGFFAASGVRALVGLGAIVLGIIALVGVDRVTVDLVALLAIGAGVLLSSAAVAGLLARAGRTA